MATGQLVGVIRQLRKVTRSQEDAGMSDGQLLERFIAAREETAFATLLRRHGPMVLGVCQRLLRNHHDADDAFQATFLVLVRKAASIVPREMVGNWLYGVACRTSLEARKATARRRAKEKGADMHRPKTPAADVWEELQPLLDQELCRLPDKYRVPIVLCDLEGKTHIQAARQLGWPQGTLSSRLVRARAMLARRMARHGVCLSAAALAAVLAQNVVSASVPNSLAMSTIKVSFLFAAGKSMAGAHSGNVIALAKGVLNAMLLNKLKPVTVLLAVLTAALLATTAGAFRTVAAAEPDTSPALEKPGNQETTRPAKIPETRPVKTIRGTWTLESVERSGKHLAVEKGSIQLVVTNRFMIWEERGEDRPFVYKLNPEKSHINLTSLVEGQDKGKTILGIYGIDGDELRICESDRARPAGFTAPPGSGHTLFIYRRVARNAGSMSPTARTHEPSVADIERRLVKPISLNLKDCPLQQVLSSIRTMTGLNIVLDAEALKEASVALDAPLSLTVEKISARSALNLLLKQVHLRYILKDEIVLVTTEDRARGPASPRRPTASIPESKDAFAERTATDIQWVDYNQGREEAQQKNRPIFVLVRKSDEPFTRKLENMVLSNSQVAALLNRRFVPIRMDADTDAHFVEFMRIASFPTMIIAGPDGRILDKMARYESVEKLGEWLRKNLASAKPQAAFFSKQAPADIIHTNQRQHSIPVSISPGRRQEIREVMLFVSADKGKTWRQEAAIPPSKDCFTFYAPSDGEYWFRVAVVDRLGKQEPENIDRVSHNATQKIVIDTQRTLPAPRRDPDISKAKDAAPLLQVDSSSPTWADKLFRAMGPTSHDFGTIAAGAQLKHRFLLKNIYKVPLEITSIRTTCGCVSWMAKLDLQPNEVGVVEVTMDARRFRGAKTASVYVTVGPEYTSTAILRVSANARQDEGGGKD